MILQELIRANRNATAAMPRWVLPFYWLAAACVVLFSAVIGLVGAFCLSMRPVYERDGAGGR